MTEWLPRLLSQLAGMVNDRLWKKDASDPDLRNESAIQGHEASCLDAATALRVLNVMALIGAPEPKMTAEPDEAGIRIVVPKRLSLVFRFSGYVEAALK